MPSAVDEQPGASSPKLSGGRHPKPSRGWSRYLGCAEEFHADTLYDVSSSGIYKIKGVSDVFAGRVEHGIMKPGECPGDNVDFNIKGLDKNKYDSFRRRDGVQEGDSARSRRKLSKRRT